MMKAKAENQDMEKENPTRFNLRPHQLLVCRISSNKLTTLQQHQAQGMFLFFSETDPACVNVLTATHEEQEYKRRTRRGGQNQRDEVARQNREGTKRFPVLEKLEHFNQLYNVDQRKCPEKLVYRRARLHGSHGGKALHFSCQHILKIQRYLNALSRQRYQLRIRVPFHVMPHRLLKHVRQD